MRYIDVLKVQKWHLACGIYAKYCHKHKPTPTKIVHPNQEYSQNRR